MREVDACHHAATDAHHQAHASAQQEERRHYVDCCQCVAAHSMPYEGSVGDVEHHHGDQSEQRGKEHLAEEPPYGFVCEIQRVAIGRFLFHWLGCVL